MLLKPITKLLVNILLGLLLLVVFNFVGQSFQMSIGVNVVSLGVIAVLGVPGFALLLLLQLIFG